MIASIITFWSLWSLLHGRPTKGTGCESLATERVVIADRIYACPGTIASGGVYGADAEALCRSGYHVCKSALEVEGLGLTEALCVGIPNLAAEEFFATQETSDGNLRCYSHNGGDLANQGTIYNDIWGCSFKNSAHYSHVAGTTDECGVLTGWVGQHDILGWEYQGDHTQEAVETKLTNAVNGGVLCCKDRAWLGCADIGESYDPKHHCKCQKECTEPYCNHIDVVSKALDEPIASGICPTGYDCCCSCPNCGANWLGWINVD